MANPPRLQVFSTKSTSDELDDESVEPSSKLADSSINDCTLSLTILSKQQAQELSLVE